MVKGQAPHRRLRDGETRLCLGDTHEHGVPGPSSGGNDDVVRREQGLRRSTGGGRSNRDTEVPLPPLASSQSAPERPSDSLLAVAGCSPTLPIPSAPKHGWAGGTAWGESHTHLFAVFTDSAHRVLVHEAGFDVQVLDFSAKMVAITIPVRCGSCSWLLLVT